MIVVLGRRQMSSREVLNLVPGAIIEFPKSADEELELMVNNKPIALGRAVKVGENFGIRLSFIGDLKNRIAALVGAPVSPVAPAPLAPALTPDAAPRAVAA